MPARKTKIPNEPAQPAQIIRDQNDVPVGITSPEGVTLTGLSQGQIRELTELYAKRRGLGSSTGETAGVVEQADVKKLKETEKAQQQIIQEQDPELRELNFPLKPEEKVPAVGAGAAITGRLLIDEVISGINKNYGIGLKGGADSRLEPEILQTLAATEVERQVYEEGLTANQKLGAIIEAIPIVGALARKYIKGITLTPSGEVDDLIAEIDINLNLAKVSVDLSLAGQYDAQQAITSIENTELELQRLESKMKFLIGYSAILQSNPEQVNALELKILLARKELLKYKLQVAGL